MHSLLAPSVNPSVVCSRLAARRCLEASLCWLQIAQKAVFAGWMSEEPLCPCPCLYPSAPAAATRTRACPRIRVHRHMPLSGVQNRGLHRCLVLIRWRAALCEIPTRGAGHYTQVPLPGFPHVWSDPVRVSTRGQREAGGRRSCGERPPLSAVAWHIAPTVPHAPIRRVRGTRALARAHPSVQTSARAYTP